VTKQVNVQKATPTELYAKKAPYSSVSNDVVAMIVNPDALAIWIYLQTRSSDWKVIASYLQERFSIGRDRYWKAMSCLKELGLLSYETLREEGTGKMLGKRIIVHYEPTLQKTVDSGNRSDGDPSIRENDPYSIKDSSTESSEVKPTVAKAPAVEVRDQVSDSESDSDRKPLAKAKRQNCPAQQIADLFNETLSPSLPAVVLMNDDRKAKVKARWNENPVHQSIDFWAEYFGLVKQSDFLMGKAPGKNGGKPFRATFDWLIAPSNFVKVVEGNYHA
jgi:hypothetical protein